MSEKQDTFWIFCQRANIEPQTHEGARAAMEAAARDAPLGSTFYLMQSVAKCHLELPKDAAVVWADIKPPPDTAAAGGV